MVYVTMWTVDATFGDMGQLFIKLIFIYYDNLPLLHRGTRVI